MVITNSKEEATYVAFPTHSYDKWIIAKLDDHFRAIVRETQSEEMADAAFPLGKGPAVSLTDRLFDAGTALAGHPDTESDHLYIKATDTEMIPLFESYNMALGHSCDTDFIEGFIRLMAFSARGDREEQYI